MIRRKAFDLGNLVGTYVESDPPSNIVPFRGKFPLVPEVASREYNRYIASSLYVDECPLWVQKVLYNGLQIRAIDRGFREYLDENKITDFVEKSPKEKTEILMKFLDSHSMTLEYLDIN